jgi:hypothetical protein
MIWWARRHGSFDAQWRYFKTYAEARAAAPGGVFSVVDITTKPRRPLPPIPELLRRGRYVEPEVSPYPWRGPGERRDP